MMLLLGFRSFSSLCVFVAGWIFLAGVLDAQAGAVVAVFGNDPGRGDLIELLRKEKGREIRTIDEEELLEIVSLAPDFLLMASGAKIPPESRRAIHRYRAQGGSLIVLEPSAFSYPASLEEPVSVVDFQDRESFSVRASALQEKKPEVELTATQTPGGSFNAIRVATREVGNGDVLLEIPMGKVRSGERTMLGFQAQGSHGTGILYLSILDRKGHRWITFVDLSLEWQGYELRLVDFVRGKKEADGTERLIPEEAKVLEVGMVSRVLWPESSAAFSIGEVVLGRGAGEDTVRSAAVALWEDQDEARSAFFPEWFQDPFWGTSEIRVKDSVTGSFWAIPEPPHKRGRVNAPASTKLKPGDYQRRILATLLNEKDEREVVAEWRRFTDGPFAGGSLVLMGAPGESFTENSRWGQLLRETVRRMERPAIVRVAPVLPKWRGGETPMEMWVTVANPGQKPMDGNILVSFAKDVVTGTAAVSVKAGEEMKVAVPLSVVPADFSWKHFGWEVELQDDGKRVDVLRDTVDLPGLLVASARHLVRVQNWHGDGRYSHHFFSDQYAARFLAGFARWLGKTGKAEELGLTEGEIEQFRESAFRFGDMIVRRQAEDGSFPMGYMEHRDFVYVADLGQVALGMVQMASWLEEGEPPRDAYLNTVRRYREFRESFYMTPERVGKLEEEYGADPKSIREGHYGLGHLDLDYFGKDKWGVLRREERGPWWVLPVSMAFLGGLAQVDDAPAVAENLERDIRFYLDSRYEIGSGSHFHAESLFWMIESVEDSEIRAQLVEKLKNELPLQLFKGAEYPYFEKQGRAALWPLSAVYGREFLGDSPVWRAAILAGLVSVGSDTSSHSLVNVASRYPRTTYGPSLAANRYVGFSALWMLELLDQGSSLMKPTAED